jgi:hypothetical protein
MDHLTRRNCLLFKQKMNNEMSEIHIWEQLHLSILAYMSGAYMYVISVNLHLQTLNPIIYSVGVQNSQWVREGVTLSELPDPLSSRECDTRKYHQHLHTLGQVIAANAQTQSTEKLEGKEKRFTPSFPPLICF